MIKNWKYILAISASFTFSTAAFAQTVQTAQRATDLERYSDATKTLRALSKGGGSDEAAFYLGDAYLKAGKTDSAAIAYNQGFAANPKSALSMVGAGKAALINGNTAEAEKQFEAAIKASRKKDANIYTQIGQAYADAKAKDVTKAIGYLKEAERLTKNNSAPVYLALGDVYLTQPNGGGDAATAYDNAIRVDPKFAKAHLRRGQLFMRARNYNEAERALQQAIAIDASFAPAYRELGEMYYFVGKYDQSLENYKKYISMAEDTPETRAKYASFLFLTKDYANTQKEAQAVLAKDPNNPVMTRLLALSLYETNQNDQALTTMETYFKNAKETDIIGSDYAYYGRILARAGKADLAATNFEKALTMDPENIELKDDIADFYVKQKQAAKAIPVYQAIIATQPKNLNVYNVKLANAYFENKQYDEAGALYATVLKTNPTYVPALWAQAQIQTAKDADNSGDAKAAYEELVKVINQDPAKAQTYKSYLVAANYNLGFYAHKAKDYATAKKYWTEVKRLDPANKEATTGLANIAAVTKGK